MNQSSHSQEQDSPDLISVIDKQASLVRIKRNDLSFNELADMYVNNELIISPEYQRLFRWSEADQSRFIESLLLGLPIPPIFLVETQDNVYELVDGLQRLSTYLRFVGKLNPPQGVEEDLDRDDEDMPISDLDPVDDAFRYSQSLILSDCDIVPDLNGLSYETLPTPMSIKLRRCYVRAEILEKGSDARLRYHLFKRLNRGGEQLTNQEVRNATIRLLDSTFIEFVSGLTRNTHFRKVTRITSERSQNAYRAELVVRFFAFKNSMENYEHNLSSFLDDYVEAVATADAAFAAGGEPVSGQFDYASERQTFEDVFALCAKIEEINKWERQIFGSVGRSGEPAQQLSGFHFDAIVTALADILPDLGDVDLPKVAKVTASAKSDPEFTRLAGGGRNYRAMAVARRDFFVDAYRRAIEE